MDPEPSSAETDDILNPPQLVAAPVATPAAEEPASRPAERFQTGWVDNPGGKIVMLSWNPGAGCRNMFDIIGGSGYNLVVLQEAKKEWLQRWPEGWTCTVENWQLFAARSPVALIDLIACH